MPIYKLALVLLIALQTPSLAPAQTGSGTSAVSLGSPVEAYEFHPGLLLTVARDANGKPLELIIHKATLAGRAHPSTSITENQVAAILDEVAPIAVRGDRLESGTSTFCSGLCRESREYAGAVVTLVYNEYAPVREILWLEVRFRESSGKPSSAARPN